MGPLPTCSAGTFIREGENMEEFGPPSQSPFSFNRCSPFEVFGSYTVTV